MIFCTEGKQIMSGDPLTLAAELTIALLEFRRSANERSAGLGDRLLESIVRSAHDEKAIEALEREHAAQAEKEAEK